MSVLGGFWEIFKSSHWCWWLNGACCSSYYCCCTCHVIDNYNVCGDDFLIDGIRWRLKHINFRLVYYKIPSFSLTLLLIVIWVPQMRNNWLLRECVKRFEEFMNFWIEFYEHLFVITFCFHIGFYCLSLNKKHFNIQLLRFHTLIVFGPPILSVRRYGGSNSNSSSKVQLLMWKGPLFDRTHFYALEDTHAHAVVAQRLLL